MSKAIFYYNKFSTQDPCVVYLNGRFYKTTQIHHTVQIENLKSKVTGVQTLECEDENDSNSSTRTNSSSNTSS